MVHEIAFAELVLDEPVGGAGVGYAQQRFGEHHQREAFFGGKREFAQHVLDAAETVVTGANGIDQARRGTVDPRLLLRAQVEPLQEAALRWRHRPARKPL